MAPFSNKVSAVQRIPAEVWSRIFMYAVANPVANDSICSAISLVCKTWCRTLYTTKAIWTTIDFAFGEQAEHPPLETQTTQSNWAFLRQSLDLAHPLPLDIKIQCNVRRDTDYSMQNHQDLTNMFNILLPHAVHWRSFAIAAPVDILRLLLLQGGIGRVVEAPALDRLVLTSNDLLSRDKQHQFESMTPLSLPSSLHHLEINFSWTRLAPHWSALQSLSTGFQNLVECRRILAQTISLTTLKLSHVGRGEMDAKVTPFTVDNVTELYASSCAMHAVRDVLLLPELVVLVLGNAEDLHTHSAHQHGDNTPEEDRCPKANLDTKWFSLDKDFVENASPILTRAKGRLHTLHVAHTFEDPVGALVPLLRSVQDSLTTLGLHDVSRQKADLGALLRLLADLRELPHLHTLEVVDNRRDLAFESPALEELVVARWGPAGDAGFGSTSKRATPLHTVRFGRRDFEEWYDGGFGPNMRSTEVYANSSLAKTLFKCVDEGLNVKWQAGEMNLFDVARERVVKSKWI